MTSDQIRTVTLALVLAVLVVPFGGPYALPVVLAIAAVAGFDLYRQAQRREAVARGEPVTTPRPIRSAPDILVRVAALIAGFVVLVVIATAAGYGR